LDYRCRQPESVTQKSIAPAIACGGVLAKLVRTIDVPPGSPGQFVHDTTLSNFQIVATLCLYQM
jgi:hypothetical protein